MERPVVDTDGEVRPANVPAEYTEPSHTTPAPRASNMVGMIRELAETLIVAVIIVFITNTFLAQSTIVLGQSMEPTLHNEERILVDKISYRLHPPQRGDVIVFNPPNGSKVPFIKRVIGVPGDEVAIHRGKVYINGNEIKEPYLRQSSDLAVTSMSDLDPVKVEADEVFVLGDNRGASNDSRYFGDVSFSSIIGKGFVAYWPLNRLGLIQ